MSSSSKSPQTHEPNPQSNTVPQTKTLKTENNLETQEQIPEKNTLLEEKVEKEDEDEEEGECGFCLYMKAGGCKDSFTEWEKCVEEGENNKEDIAEKCFEVTSALQKCMEAHSDYYAPILQVEKDIEAKVIKEREKELTDNKESVSMETGSGEGSNSFDQKEGL
ncbi:uncharacterized protein [Nicotiana sylvestris]|uniref:GCK domain-containing protein n=2 Tax=Nicotiana TaxID=4085 RepID=A0A1S3XZY4_TOBAC|nr:PREDICTED: uncharacterized protein LOC104218695 [Nicotiana sylvestris]XP_009767550.1 PREDICTED: uncharacterized protein LOC104218695 [Nicotiana sylvestris]XP_009767551.1 PREDICTED: uncharacterized protein LOC104218695 [Nicotiana sylvestris]XP_009767552.1 PREDICTED: uncharacterized protein LOC104218695 [Nicotiana sylvestris]XP_016445370.1 PREDICTED: uncharacterized protein LOC107770564 [Nicotiana tabacum]